MEIIRDVYVADFETITTEPTRVWAWGFCRCGNLKNNKVVIGNTIHSFLNYVFNIKRSCAIYFHNLSFDGYFILYHLIDYNFKLVKTYKPKNNREYTELIDENGEIYSISIKMNGRIFNFYDSFKIFSNSLNNLSKSFNLKNKKLNLDYSSHQYDNYKINEDEKKYLINDVLILSELMYKFYKKFNYVEMTISSQSFRNFKKQNQIKFKQDFLELTEEDDEYMRGAYRGGICCISPLIQKNKIIKCKNGCVYDYNSMYPSMLHSISGNYYPVGKPVPINNIEELEHYINNNYLFVIKISCKFKIKKNRIPCISSIKSSLRGDDKWEAESKTMTILTLTNIDFKLLIENYDIENLSFHSGLVFKNKKIGLFDDFINYWYEMKKNSDADVREFAKMMLNGLIGKFAQRLKMGRKFVSIDEATKKFKNKLIIDKTKPVYLPIALFCTAYSRATLVEAINNNYENFLYADTDSIHLKDEAKNIKIGKDLLTWKKENKIIKAKYIKLKSYIEKIDNKKYLVKIAGLPLESRPVFKSDKIFNYYKKGLTIKNAKLRQCKCEGGVILKPTDFTIK